VGACRMKCVYTHEIIRNAETWCEVCRKKALEKQ